MYSHVYIYIYCICIFIYVCRTCICICVYIHTCIYIYTCMCTYIYIYIYLYKYIYINVCIVHMYCTYVLCIYVLYIYVLYICIVHICIVHICIVHICVVHMYCTYVCTHVCMYACMQACMNICICISNHTVSLACSFFTSMLPLRVFLSRSLPLSLSLLCARSDSISLSLSLSLFCSRARSLSLSLSLTLSLSPPRLARYLVHPVSFPPLSSLPRSLPSPLTVPFLCDLLIVAFLSFCPLRLKLLQTHLAVHASWQEDRSWKAPPSSPSPTFAWRLGLDGHGRMHAVWCVASWTCWTAVIRITWLRPIAIS